MLSAEIIQMEGVTKKFGSFTVIKDLNLSITKGCIYALVGESGSGKTTCLRMMNGLSIPDEGIVRLKGEIFDYSKGDLLRREMGYAQQGSGLFPHFSVFENVSLIAKK